MADILLSYQDVLPQRWCACEPRRQYSCAAPSRVFVFRGETHEEGSKGQTASERQTDGADKSGATAADTAVSGTAPGQAGHRAGAGAAPTLPRREPSRCQQAQGK